MTNKYRVVSAWDDLQKKEVIIEAEAFSSWSSDGKIRTVFYNVSGRSLYEEIELVAVFWGEVIVIKQ